MLSTAHLVSGAAIGLASSNYIEALVFSVIFHFILDMVPHWDPDFKKDRRFFLIASFDLLFGLLLSFYLVGNRLDSIVILAMAFSIMPDVISFFVLLSDKKYGRSYLAWHKLIQNKDAGWGGFLSQLLVVFIVSMVILYG